MMSYVKKDMGKKKSIKLIVMIPAYNEEKTISQVISSIPRKIEGISEVEVLVIDDGSTDNTVEVSKEAGADYVVVGSGIWKSKDPISALRKLEEMVS